MYNINVIIISTEEWEQIPLFNVVRGMRGEDIGK